MALKKTEYPTTPSKPTSIARTSANIPTRELADYVVKEGQEPYNRLYPSDPSLNPQLVW